MKLKMGLFGLGAWGRNYLRLLKQNPQLSLIFVCDLNENSLGFVSNSDSGIGLYTDYKQAISENEIHAAIVATDVHSHFKICETLLNAGIHVLCEKPVSDKVREVEELSQLASHKNLVLLPGHLFIYNDAFQFAKNIIRGNELGRILYFNFQRNGPGPIRNDVSAAFDLATHDISMLLNLVDGQPNKIFQFGNSYLKRNNDDVVFIRIEFLSGVVANFHVSWLYPRKIREMTIIGEKKMLVFDDVNQTEKLRIYDKEISFQPNTGDFGEFQLNIQGGDITVPKIKFREPLKLQLDDFISSITNKNHKPLTSIADALRVVKILNGICS